MNTTMESIIIGEMDVLQKTWGTAATLCFVNFVAGLMVATFTGHSSLTTVPIVVSAAGTLANAIYCFTAVGFFANGISQSTALSRKAVSGYLAATFLSDMFWLVSRHSPWRICPLEGCLQTSNY